MSFIFISKQISKSLSLRASTPESHEIFDFAEAELVPQHEIEDFVEAELVPQHEIEDFVEAELVPQSDQASPGCPGQYWRVGSSPISRTGVKDIRFSSVLFII